MSETFLTIPSDFSRSTSRRSSKRSTIVTAESVTTNAAYYDALISAINEGKSETDAIQHAKAVVTSIDEDIKLKQITGNNKPMASNMLKMQASDEEPNDAYDNDSREEDDNDEDDVSIEINPGSKSMNAYSKLQTAFKKISRFEMLKKQSNARKDPVEIHNIREIYKKLDLTVNQYDSIMEKALEDNEFHLEKKSNLQLLECEEKFKARLKAQYESLKSHKECDFQISSLKKENSYLKDELKVVIANNSKISSELSNLKIYKSNVEEEIRMMSEKLANRRAQIKRLNKRIWDQKELRLANNCDLQEDQTCHESYQSGNEFTDLSDDDISNGDIDASPDNYKPKWNTTRHTNLLKQDVFSIMHNIEYANDNPTAKLKEKSADEYQKIHKKYKNQISSLKIQLESERVEARKASARNTKRSYKMKKIIQVLKECLQVLKTDQIDTDQTIADSETKSLSSISSRRKEVEAIFERKELLTNLISGLHRPFAEYDGYSSTEKEDTQIMRSSRPSSAPSTKEPLDRAPIVPIQLKREKSIKIMRKSNEFHSVKSWVIAAKNRKIKAHPVIKSVSLIESNIKKEIEPSNAKTEKNGKPELESIMRKSRPISARTNASQNSVRFAPILLKPNDPGQERMVSKS